jgi:hypothetical protein
MIRLLLEIPDEVYAADPRGVCRRHFAKRGHALERAPRLVKRGFQAFGARRPAR